jgi:hypothetical protein
MISLDYVEDAPPGKHPADEGASTAVFAVSEGVEKQPEADDGEYPGGGVEEPVGAHVGFHAVQGGCRPAVRTGQHVVPLRDLVEDDPVEEPAQSQAEENSGASSGSRVLPGLRQCVVATPLIMSTEAGL